MCGVDKFSWRYSPFTSLPMPTIIDDTLAERTESSMAKSSRESPVFQLVRQTDEKHTEGHHRLRADWRDHDERLTKLEATLSELGFKVQMLATATPDISKMTLSPGIVVSIVMAIMGIVGGQLASTWGMRSDIRDINTKLNLRAQEDVSLQKLQEERANALRNATDAIGKKQELLQIKFDELRDQVLGQQRKPR